MPPEHHLVLVTMPTGTGGSRSMSMAHQRPVSLMTLLRMLVQQHGPVARAAFLSPGQMAMPRASHQSSISPILRVALLLPNRACSFLPSKLQTDLSRRAIRPLLYKAETASRLL